MSDLTGVVRLRAARPDEAEALSELTLRSKAFWGFDVLSRLKAGDSNLSGRRSRWFAVHGPVRRLEGSPRCHGPPGRESAWPPRIHSPRIHS
jgi:hypothetical protein